LPKHKNVITLIFAQRISITLIMRAKPKNDGGWGIKNIFKFGQVSKISQKKNCGELV